MRVIKTRRLTKRHKKVLDEWLREKKRANPRFKVINLPEDLLERLMDVGYYDGLEADAYRYITDKNDGQFDFSPGW